MTDERVTLNEFTYETAMKISGYLQERALHEKLPISYEIFHGSTLISMAVLPGATADNACWALRKRNTALRFQRSSLSVKEMCDEGGFDLNVGYRLPPEEFVASGGSIPIFVDNVGMVGAISVSGLTDIEDHKIVLAALDHVKSSQ